MDNCLSIYGTKWSAQNLSYRKIKPIGFLLGENSSSLERLGDQPGQGFAWAIRQMSKVPLSSPDIKEKVISQRIMNKERAPNMRSILDSDWIANTLSSDCTCQLSVHLQILSGVCESEMPSTGQAQGRPQLLKMGNLAKASPCPALTTVFEIKGKSIFYTSKISVARQSKANSSPPHFPALIFTKKETEVSRGEVNSPYSSRFGYQ